MVLRLSILTHAATSATRAGRFPDDEPLEERASAELGSPMAARYDAVLVAPERRTAETASLLGFEGRVEPKLADWNYGLWRGRSLHELMAEDPSGVAAWLQEPDSRPHGGESLRDLLARAESWLRGLQAEDPGEAAPQRRVLAVTHPAILRAVLAGILEAPPAAFRRIDVPPLAALEISGRQGGWSLRKLGCFL